MLDPFAAGQHDSGENRSADEDEEYESDDQEDEEDEGSEEEEEKERCRAWEGLSCKFLRFSLFFFSICCVLGRFSP